jgi:sulfite reductase (ferredoxin)
MSRNEPPRYPAPHVPAELAEQKLLGLYDQRQPGLMLQRVRVPGGRLSTAQWRAIADAAEQVSARDALHLTTRQCVEVHGLTPEAVPQLQVALSAAGLSTVGAAGDTVRNFTVDAEAGYAPNTVDLMPLAEAITEAVEALPGIWSLPRKFKISLSASVESRMRPWMSDVGLVATGDSFTAIIAGSLGAKPGTGLLYREGLTAEQAVAVCVAAVRLHALEGDRENRRRARLRHARERMGDEPFLARMDELFAEALKETHGPLQALSRVASSSSTHLRLAVTHGDLPLGTLRDLADAVDGADGEMRIGIEHELHIFGVSPDELPDAARPWLRPGRVVACPGTALCPKAATPTYEAADALAELADDYPDRLFAISGCPNSCSHAMVADVGILGRMKRDGEERVVVYDVYAGGEAGRGPALAIKSATAVPVEQLRKTVNDLLTGGMEVS